MYGKDYDSQQVEAIQKEIDNLNTTWMMYSHEEENGRNAHLHYPPALFMSLVRLFENFGNEELDYDNLDVQCVTTPKNVANFAAAIFEWAQVASKNGILAANMTPCNCANITDEDIQTLLGDSNGSGDNRPS